MGEFHLRQRPEYGRFLDPPEFTVMHDKGNEENVFDRVDFQISSNDSIHLNFGYSRSWFQTPNSFDAQNATAWSGLEGVLRQWRRIQGVFPERIAPSERQTSGRRLGHSTLLLSWTHVLSTDAVFTLGTFVRRDDYNYYPSGDAFADLGPPSLQRQSVGQNRTLTNAGLRCSDLSYV